MIFVKVANLAGIKDPISDINKTDISEMILKFYNGLSLEEIDYAFKMERYGFLGDKTEHFQLFNSDYVSTVLKKYKNWLKEKRITHNISLDSKEEQQEMSQEEKDNLVFGGCMNCFEQYKQDGRVLPGYAWVYDHLHELKLLPKHTKEFKAEILARANKAITETFDGAPLTYHVKEEISRYKQGKGVKSKCKQIILEDYFKELIKQDKHLKEIL